MVTPKLRIDALYDIQTALYNAIRALDQPLYRSCLNCMKFNEKAELCALCNQRPPAKVIAYGCDQWEDVREVPY